jgi:hypothetical protein
VDNETICVHCGESIGPWKGWEYLAHGWFRVTRWMHNPDDGPDSYQECQCHCAECDPINGYTNGRECIDGKEARPDLLITSEPRGLDMIPEVKL